MGYTVYETGLFDMVVLCHFRLYPVDKSRVNEYGVSYDEKPKGKSHKD